MSEAKLPDNVSPALARFADVLCMYNSKCSVRNSGICSLGLEVA